MWCVRMMGPMSTVLEACCPPKAARHESVLAIYYSLSSANRRFLHWPPVWVPYTSWAWEAASPQWSSLLPPLIPHPAGWPLLSWLLPAGRQGKSPDLTCCRWPCTWWRCSSCIRGRSCAYSWARQTLSRWCRTARRFTLQTEERGTCRTYAVVGI